MGIAERAPVDYDFRETLESLSEELAVLNTKAHSLEERITENVAALLDGITG